MNEITLYPNPAQSEFVVSLGNNVSENVNFNIYDLTGRAVPYSADQISDSEYRIYGLPKGVYYIEVRTGVVFWKSKVVILPF